MNCFNVFISLPKQRSCGRNWTYSVGSFWLLQFQFKRNAFDSWQRTGILCRQFAVSITCCYRFSHPIVEHFLQIFVGLKRTKKVVLDICGDGACLYFVGWAALKMRKVQWPIWNGTEAICSCLQYFKSFTLKAELLAYFIHARICNLHFAPTMGHQGPKWVNPENNLCTFSAQQLILWELQRKILRWCNLRMKRASI